MPKKFLIFISLFLIGSFWTIKTVQAGPEHNVSGFAWSENIGWISFNSTNCDVDGDGTYEGLNEGGAATPAPTGCPSSGIVKSYGVTIATDGKLSGQAWAGGGENADGSPAPTIGWISFERTETGAPPKDDPCSVSKDCIAMTEEPLSSCPGMCLVLGWARACGILFGESTVQCGGGGWDGWIKLSGAVQAGGSYEVTIDTSSGPPYEFHGWAWGGDPEGDLGEAVVGWLSFNCEEGGDGSTNICGQSNYAVTYNPLNDAPTASSLSKPSTIVCGATPKAQITFQWTYTDPNGDDQTHYQLQVATDAGFSNLVVDSGEVVQSVDIDPPPNNTGDGTSGVDVLTSSMTPQLDDLQIRYSLSNYYWRIKVKDGNEWSGWLPDENGLSFKTPSNALPEPYISVDNDKPEIGETVTFSDFNGENDSTCWDINNNSDACRKDAGNRYIWEIYSGTGETKVWIKTYDTGLNNEYPEYRGSISYSFDTIDPYTIKLIIEDQSYISNDSHSGQCSEEITINVGMPKPEWKEIPPFGRILKQTFSLNSINNSIKNVFANISSFFKVLP